MRQVIIFLLVIPHIAIAEVPFDSIQKCFLFQMDHVIACGSTGAEPLRSRCIASACSALIPPGGCRDAFKAHVAGGPLPAKACQAWMAEVRPKYVKAVQSAGDTPSYILLYFRNALVLQILLPHLGFSPPWVHEYVRQGIIHTAVMSNLWIARQYEYRLEIGGDPDYVIARQAVIMLVDWMWWEEGRRPRAPLRDLK